MKLKITKTDTLRSATILAVLTMLSIRKLFTSNDFSQIKYLIVASTILVSISASLYFLYRFFTLNEEILSIPFFKYMEIGSFGAGAVALCMLNFPPDFMTASLWSLSMVYSFTLGLGSFFYAIRLAFWKYYFKKQQPST